MCYFTSFPLPDKLVPSVFRLLSEYGHSITGCLVALLPLFFLAALRDLKQSIGVFALSNWLVNCVMSGPGVFCETLDFIAVSPVTVR